MQEHNAIYDVRNNFAAANAMDFWTQWQQNYFWTKVHIFWRLLTGARTLIWGGPFSSCLNVLCIKTQCTILRSWYHCHRLTGNSRSAWLRDCFHVHSVLMFLSAVYTSKSCARLFRLELAWSYMVLQLPRLDATWRTKFKWTGLVIFSDRYFGFSIKHN